MGGERRRSPAEARRFWELAIDLWSSSGLSVADFCGREGLKESSFYRWQRRLREGSETAETVDKPAVEPTLVQPVAEPKARKPPQQRKRLRRSQDAGGLMPVRVVGDGSPTADGQSRVVKSCWPIEVVLSRGARIRVKDGCTADFLRRVLAVLENLPC